MGQVVKSLNTNPILGKIAGNYARQAALIPGVARGVWHTGEDLYDAAVFADRVMHPFRELSQSAPGETVYEQTARSAMNLADRAAYAWENPQSVVDGITQGLDRANKNLNPYATPQGQTVAEEIARNWTIGLNQGELAFDVGSLAYGGAELKGLRLAMRGGKPLTAADMMARKIPANLAEDFAQPYSGIGHHIIQKDFKPWWLGGRPVPEAIRQHPYVRLKPSGLTKGEFYKRHYEVDRHYKGAELLPSSAV